MPACLPACMHAVTTAVRSVRIQRGRKPPTNKTGRKSKISSDAGIALKDKIARHATGCCTRPPPSHLQPAIPFRPGKTLAKPLRSNAGRPVHPIRRGAQLVQRAGHEIHAHRMLGDGPPRLDRRRRLSRRPSIRIQPCFAAGRTVAIDVRPEGPVAHAGPVTP